MTRPPSAAHASAARRVRLRRWLGAGVAVIAVVALGTPLLIWNPVALGVGVLGALVSLRLRRRLQQVRATADAPLSTLMNLLEVRDNVSPGHAYRVALVARALAEASGCDRREVERTTRAASLHNIGSLAISPSLPTTPTPLTADQERDLARHAVIGAEALGASVVARELVPIVRHHHERWDGAGYPDKLAGEAIPLGARIVAVANAAVALRSRRPYRDALEVDAMIAVLRDGASRQWDPRVVDHLVTLIAIAHPPVVAALETVGRVDGASTPSGPIVQDSIPWTGAPKLGREPSHRNVTTLPAPNGATESDHEGGIVAHE